MEDIKQHAAKLPTQAGKDSSQPVMLSVEENAKLRKEANARQKEQKEKEGKTVKGNKAIGKKHLNKMGRRMGQHSPQRKTRTRQMMVSKASPKKSSIFPL